MIQACSFDAIFDAIAVILLSEVDTDATSSPDLRVDRKTVECTMGRLHHGLTRRMFR
jgi:hypothetical protein